MELTERLDTHQKALNFNLDPTTFGSFAEIGAGQEVVRWFLIVGGASGTVAKSISAYDKEVSDDIYGSGSRYVSKERLEAMLNSEWGQLLNQLSQARGSRTCFFSFVDTVAALNYAGTNDPHGWVGLRFQLQPCGPPNDIVLHINMRDRSNLLQQQAIGILGVNLIYTAFRKSQTQESFLDGTIQDVKTRIEIDYVDLRGPAFETWDKRELIASLVSAGLAEAVCFPSNGSSVPPTEALYKKAVVLAPGFFEHTDSIHAEIHESIVAAGVQQLRTELGEKGPTPIGFFCLSASSLQADVPFPTVPDLLRRIDALVARGGDVLLFRGRELYTMTDLVNRYTKEHVRFVVGLSLLIRVFEDRYNTLDGRLLEALSRLLAQNVRIYSYPMKTADFQEAIHASSGTRWQWKERNGWVSANDLRAAPPLGHLFDYVLASGFLVPMQAPMAAKADA
jgi:hypothetical protein